MVKYRIFVVYKIYKNECDYDDYSWDLIHVKYTLGGYDRVSMDVLDNYG